MAQASLHEDTRIIALAREPGSAQEHLAFITSELRRYVGAKELDEAVVERFPGAPELPARRLPQA